MQANSEQILEFIANTVKFKPESDIGESDMRLYLGDPNLWSMVFQRWRHVRLDGFLCLQSQGFKRNYLNSENLLLYILEILKSTKG